LRAKRGNLRRLLRHCVPRNDNFLLSSTLTRRGLLMKMDIEKVARLARLELSEREKEIFGNQLEQILAYMEQLNRLDTTGIEPTSHAIPLCNAFREDEAKPSYPKDDVLGISPAQEDGHLKVPRIIE
jgi:aspartyl-tRNA(Asn)/glutamyl-tRNA(Gln) amidotransferase subunit C